MSFTQWLGGRPEIELILNSLNNPKTVIFTSPTHFGYDSSISCINTPMPNSDENENAPSSDAKAPKDKTQSFVYKHINGLVLNLNSIIKDDYFPGSRNVHLVRPVHVSEV